MGKVSRLFICGGLSVGKTSLIEQALFGNLNPPAEKPPFRTIEDIYVANIETDRGVKEKVRLFDTAGLEVPDLPKHYYASADGFLLVYSITSRDSFQLVEKLKKEIDRNREKKEMHVVAVGNKRDMEEDRQISFSIANSWAQKEKVKLYEVSVVERSSLFEPLMYLTSKCSQPITKSGFPLGRKSKSFSSPDA